MLDQIKATKARLDSIGDRRCGTKSPFFKLQNAERAAKLILAERGEHMIGYKCPDCGCFHLGHPDLSQRIGVVTVKRGANSKPRGDGPITIRCGQCGKKILEPGPYCSQACAVKADMDREALAEAHA